MILSLLRQLTVMVMTPFVYRFCLEDKLMKRLALRKTFNIKLMNLQAVAELEFLLKESQMIKLII